MSRLARLVRSKGNQTQNRPPRSTTLRIEPLEDRLAPVVGAFDIPATIAPKANQAATQYDGVVEIEIPDLKKPGTNQQFPTVDISLKM